MASTDVDWINCTTPMPKINTTDGVSQNFGESARRHLESVTFDGTLANGTTYNRYIPIPRGATVKRAYVTAGVKIAGGVNTLAVNQVTANGATTNTLLSTATVDPTATPTAAKVGSPLTMSANPVVIQGDVIQVQIVCGTMTTAGQDYSVCLELEVNDVA